MADFANLNTKVTADITDFQRKMSSVEGLVKKAFAGLSIAAVGYEINKVVNRLDAIGDGAKKLGITTDAFQKLSYIAKLSDSSISNVESGMKSLVKTLGSSEASKAFANLGLNQEELRNMSLDKAYLSVVEALGGIKNPTDQAILAQGVFLKGGMKQLPIVRENVKAIGDEWEKTGRKIDSKEIARIDEISKSTERLKSAFESLENSIIVGMTGPLEKVIGLASKFVETMKVGGGLISQSANAIARSGDGNSWIEAARALFVKSYEGLAAGNSVLSKWERGGGWDTSPSNTGINNTGQMRYSAASIRGSRSNSITLGMQNAVGGGLDSALVSLRSAADAASKSVLDLGGAAETSISKMLKSASDKATQSELDRIIGDLINPSEDGLSSNQRYLNEQYIKDVKRSNPGWSDEKIKEGLPFGAKDKTDPMFDNDFRSAFEKIKSGGESDIDSIDSQVKRLRGLAMGDSGKMGAVNELQGFFKEMFPNANPSKPDIKVKISVEASPDFITKVTTSEDFKEGVNSMVALEAAASAAVEAAR